ncbi:helix-turn-helix transcriptional regulator [Corynebacterium epidermidicanis]|uniref:Transcriptional regulator, AlpA family n=1 Tax=Corynebacterium epidermidicanis TaxID=1050174 RepID=A0A0G3GU35_9CORY|nr:helix-turn-helix domain-containing protein [Corynebacterium epidermidicanis]AKK03078.1 transcriptional regulator, AlpA family [Corynebacterium epidermidicanis]
MTTLESLQSMLRPAELSELSGFPETTLATWRSRGRGPKFVRIMGRVYYRKTDVDAWLTDQIEASA